MTEEKALMEFSRGLVVAAIRKHGRQPFRDASLRSGLPPSAIDALLEVERKAP